MGSPTRPLANFGIRTIRQAQVDRHVGSRLRIAREDAGFSIGDLYVETSIEVEQLIHAEGGHGRLTAVEFMRVTRALGIRIADLFEGLR